MQYDDKTEQPEQKSKSQIKREFLAFQELAKELTQLANKQLDELPLSEQVLEAVKLAKTLKQGALARQLKYIGGLMPEEDVEQLKAMLAALKMPHQKKVDAFHEVEEWRDKLLTGNQALFNELAGRFENFDRQHVSQLLRNAAKEKQLNKPPKSARLLFKYLSTLSEA